MLNDLLTPQTICDLRIQSTFHITYNSAMHHGRVHGCHEPYMVRGAPSPARTGDLRIRSPTLYPTELWAPPFNFYLFFGGGGGGSIST